jgi:hypothetical protein
LTDSNAIEATRKSKADRELRGAVYIKYISISYLVNDYVTYIVSYIGSVMMLDEC